MYAARQLPTVPAVAARSGDPWWEGTLDPWALITSALIAIYASVGTQPPGAPQHTRPPFCPPEESDSDASLSAGKG